MGGGLLRSLDADTSLEPDDPAGRHLERLAHAAMALLPVAPRDGVHAIEARVRFGEVGALMGAAAFVMIISPASVANLTLMRGVDREREMLVRAALGAGTWRLITQLIQPLRKPFVLAIAMGALSVWVPR